MTWYTTARPFQQWYGVAVEMVPETPVGTMVCGFCKDAGLTWTGWTHWKPEPGPVECEKGGE